MDKKHSLIIGGTKGMGIALVRLLAKENNVTVIAREKPSCPEKTVSYFTCDITEKKQTTKTLNSIIKRRGKLNHLVFFQRFRGAGDDWDGQFVTGLSATKNIIDHLSDQFDTANASIVLISSVNALLINHYLSAGYHVAKAGVVQLARFYAVKLGPKGIRVNSVSPGTVLKEGSKEFLMKNKKLVDFYKRNAPLRRMGTAEEVADVAAFLCSPNSSFITGQDIVVDGGVSIQWPEVLYLGQK